MVDLFLICMDGGGKPWVPCIGARFFGFIKDVHPCWNCVCILCFQLLAGLKDPQSRLLKTEPQVYNLNNYHHNKHFLLSQASWHTVLFLTLLQLSNRIYTHFFQPCFCWGNTCVLEKIHICKGKKSMLRMHPGPLTGVFTKQIQIILCITDSRETWSIQGAILLLIYFINPNCLLFF